MPLPAWMHSQLAYRSADLTTEGTTDMSEKPEPTPATIIAQPEVSQAIYQQIAPGGIPGSADGMGDALTTAHLNASNEK